MISTQSGGTILQSFQQDQIQITGQIDNTKQMVFDCDSNVPSNATVTLQIPTVSGELLTTNSSVVASALNTTTLPVDVSNADPPTAGQILSATSSTTGQWNTIDALPSGTGIVVVNNGAASAVLNLFANTETVALGLNVQTADPSLSKNTAFGNGALQSDINGGRNVAVGFNALHVFNGVGNSNVSLGAYSFSSLLNGTDNTTVGIYSSAGIYNGDNNTAVGAQALFSIFDPTSNNTAFGNRAIAQAGFDTVGIGYNSGQGGATQSVAIGSESSFPDSTHINTTLIGYGDPAVNGNDQINFYNSVIIGSTSNVPSASLAISSTSQGFLPPRMTTTEKLAISSPEEGLFLYDTTLNQLSFYDGTVWNNI
jgi:hypothetical protein